MTTTDFVARALAHCDEFEQAAFFNAFFGDLAVLCKRNGNNAGTQLQFITRNLRSDVMALVEEWFDCVKWEREQIDERRRLEAPTREAIYKLREELRELEARRDVIRGTE